MSAFSLIELMTAVSIMLVIIFTLYAMFNQTQKALRANITQVDVLESGRAASEMIGREIEQLAACQLAETTNLYVAMMPASPLTLMDVNQDLKQPPLRTNILQEFFFLTRQTNKWVGTGYRVMGALGAPGLTPAVVPPPLVTVGGGSVGPGGGGVGPGGGGVGPGG